MSDHFVRIKEKISFVRPYVFNTSRRSFLTWAMGLGVGFFFLKYRMLQAAGYYNMGAFWKNGVAGIGYFAGGIDSGNSSDIDGIVFATEAAKNPAATLSVARYYPTGVNSATTAYFAGGYVAANSSDIDGLTFATEAATNPAATLAVARSGPVGVNSTTTGYFAGGVTAGNSSDIDGLTFATEAATNPSATLALARYSLTPA